MSNSLQPGRPTSADASGRDSGHWVAGIFYANPEDPRPFVPKRLGGWTFNYAHPRAWALNTALLALIGLLIAAVLLLPLVLY